MNTIRNSRKHILLLLVLIFLIENTYSNENDGATEGQRHGRVSGRIVKLYSGQKPDPILCLSEGFLADAVDCSVFYRCLKTTNGKYTVYRFQCGPGTVYDPDTEVCNHPRSTKRLGCGGLNNDKVISSTEGYIENEIDGLHKENQELPSPISTKPPKVSNSLTSTVATPIPIKSETSYITTSHPWFSTTNQVNHAMTTSSTVFPWNIPSVVSSKKPWYYTSTQDSYYVTSQPDMQHGVHCTSDGFIGDNEDCRKFYRCVSNQRGGYIRYEFSCSESTIWDDDTQGCNHPWAVQRRRCGKGNNYYENSISYIEQIKNNEVTPNNEVQQPAYNSYGSKVTQIPTSIKPVLPDQTTDLNFGDRLNAEHIYSKKNQTQHNHGALINQSQVQGNYENEVTQSQLSVNHSNQSGQTSIPYTIPSTILTTSVPYAAGSILNKCTKEGFMGDSEDCKKFYRCISNGKGEFIMHDLSCNEGTVWDDQLKACNHGWAVKECGGKRISQNMTPEATVIENTTFKNHVTSSSSSSTSSLFDSNEIDDTGYGNQNSQQEIQHPTTLMTTQPTKATTVTFDSSKPYEKQGCKSSGFFGNVNDCATFYRCVENGGGKFTKYEYKCGEGTLWDPEIQSCNHAWSVKSCDNSITSSTQQETVAAQSNSDSTIITTVSLIQTTTQKNSFDHDNDAGYQTVHSETSLQSITSTEHISDQGNECNTSGFMSGSDCKKFYRCTENGHGGYTRHEFTCGEGTVWDPNIEACNHAWAVKTCGVTSVNDNVITLAPAESQNDYLDKDVGYNMNEDDDKNSIISITTSRSSTNYVTPETNKANDCISSGFMGNKNDCKIFYRCVDNGNKGFIRYEFSCGEGTVWDPKIDACNHEWAVEKCAGSNSSSQYISTSTEYTNFTTTGISTEITTQRTLSSSSTILTSTISDTNNQCMADGFIADKQDCKKFYRCVDNGKGTYTRYEFACGEGTVWDPKIEACNHVQAVKSCGSITTPDSDRVTTSLSTMNDEGTNINHISQDTQETTSSTENSLWSSSTIKSSTIMSVSTECNKDGFIGDSNDCKKFYRCVNDGKGSFTRYEFSCGEGTLWDPEINACNHVNSVKTPCNVMTIETPEHKEPNYTTGSTSSEGYIYSTSSKEPPKLECEQEGFFGEENDCSKFYRCTDDGQGGFLRYEFTCGEGTVWDQEKLTCNHASSSSHCGSIDEESQLDHSELHTIATPTGSLQTTELIKPTSSADECAFEGFYANSNDCKKFFRCVDDGKGGFTRYDFTCGEGTIWVQDIQACDHDTDTSLCSKGAVTTPAPSPSHSSQEKPSTTISTSTTRSTTVDKSSSAPAIKPTMQDETVTGSSTISDTATTSTASSATNQDRCEEAGFFGNSKDCKKFYRCVDNGNGGFTKYDFSCGDGTIWDQDITTCNHPQDVTNPSCNSEENNETMTTTTTTKSTTTAKTTTTTLSTESSRPTEGTSSIGSTTSESSNQSTQDVSTEKPNSGNYTCNEAGFYADPYDCKKFYRCVDWGGDGKTFSIYHFECGEGTIWDPSLQTCNHEESVYPPRECSGTQSQSENNNDTTTTASSTQMSTTQSSTATTESSSSTEQTNTQQSTTTEQTSSTQQSTTQPSTTEQSTTLMSTTEQSTTQKSTTEQTTTQKSTTEQSTTQKSTTEQTTTQKSTTEQSTTQKSTTEESTTEPTTTQQSTTEQSTTQQSNTEPSTTQQSTTTSDQTTVQQSSTTQQSTTSEQTITTTTEQTTTSSNEEMTTTTAQTTSESTTSATEQTTKTEQSTTQEPTEQSSENQSTTEQSTTQDSGENASTTESGQDTTTEQESSNKDCPETDDDQYIFVCPTGFRRHPKYCNLFYQCTEDDDNHEMKVAVFNCPNNTIYDESKTQCVEENKADKKCDGQIAQRRRVKRLDINYKEPITVRKEKYLCSASGHFSFEENEQCSPLLFKCEVSKSGKLRGFVYQCPEGYIYWSISRRCEPISTMTWCKHSLSNWNSRYEIPTERKNVARKSVK